MIERKTFTYDGQNSADFGLYIAGDSVYDAPTRDMDMITIPGRNGQLSIDQGRFENITVTYPCFIWADTQEEFRTKARAIRNWLTPKHSYYRLTDEYNPESFRLGIYKSGLEVDPIFYNRAGRFELSFDCKPQRFLFTGEEVFTLGEWGETETKTGSIVSFDGTETTAIKSLKVNITPKQSGSGDPSPSNVRPISGWDAVDVGVFGRNLIKYRDDLNLPITQNGITFSEGTDGGIILNGTATATAYINITIAEQPKPIRAGETYHVKLFGAISGITLPLRRDSTWDGNADEYTVTMPEFSTTYLRLRIASGTVCDNLEVKPMMTLQSEWDGTYEAYVGSSATVNLPQTVYGGVLDVVSGELTSFPYYSSYSGQTLNGEWICDRAVYSQGTTPPTGSQVVDMSGTGTTTQLTSTEVNTLLGSNNIWADAGTVEVEIGENPNILVNPTPFTAQPVFEVEGSGTLTVGNVSMTIANNGKTIIDSEMMEAYEEEDGAIISRNDMVSGEFPTLKEGNNNIGTVGLTSVKVTPKWWEV